MQDVFARLTKPEQAAKMPNAAGPTLTFFARIVTEDLPEPLASREIVARTRAAGYAGPIIVGQDRMAFEIGANVVTLRTPRWMGWCRSAARPRTLRNRRHSGHRQSIPTIVNS